MSCAWSVMIRSNHSCLDNGTNTVIIAPRTVFDNKIDLISIVI